MQINLFEYSWIFIKTFFCKKKKKQKKKKHKNREAKHIYDTASCIHVSIIKICQSCQELTMKLSY